MNSFTDARPTASALSFAAFLSLAFVFAAPAHGATNLITNGDFSNSSVNTCATPVVGGYAPTGFCPGGYDDTATFTYATTSGPTGNDAYVSFTTTNHADGDRKWVLSGDAITVTPGALYTFSDMYKANATSYVVAAYTYADGSAHYQQLAILSNTNGAWKSVTADFTAPQVASPLKVQIFHLLKSNGTLATAHYSLTTFSNTSNDLFAKPMISLSFDDGWTTQYENAFFALKNNALNGTFYIISNPLIAASYDFFTDPNESINKVTSSNNRVISWTPIYTDPTNVTHRFAVTYTSTADVLVEATYSSGTTTIGTLPAGNAARGSLIFTLPTVTNGATTSTVTPITISMTVASGALTATNPVLNEYSEEGYMSADQLKDLAAAGDEIGAHTVSHCSLLTLAACAFPLPSGATAQSEITDSASQILSVSGLTATTLAYPYGDYNSTIEGYASGLAGARSVDFGYNRLTTDKFALKSQSVDASTTVQEVENWIDTAIANKFWLILTFHQIDTPANILKNGEDTGTTPDNLNAIIAYIKSKGSAVDVKTVAQGLAVMGNTVVDTTAPVIAVHTDVFAIATSTGSIGALVTYTNPTATDNVDASVAVTCTPASGSMFALGTTTVTCSAHDAANNAATPTTFDVGVTAPQAAPAPAIEITPATLPDTTVGTAYNATITASTSASAPYIWTIATTSLPAGLTIATSTGLTATISGTTTVASTYNFDVTVSSGASTQTKTYTVHVDPVCNLASQHLDNHICVDNQQQGGGNSVPPSSGSGGNGGSGGIVGSGPLSIGYVNTNPISLPGAVLGVSTNCFIFTQNLAVGSTGSDVTQLQTRLTMEGLFSAGATGYFGTITKSSVMAYQSKMGIEQVGSVGPKTRAALNASCTGTAAQEGAGSVLGASTFVFTKNLVVGSVGTDVSELQKILISLGFLKIAAPTGYFGSATKAALMSYQTTRGIEATGNTGPKTRAALNSNAAAVSSEK